MSYILEALKKSERERRRGNINTLQTSSQIVLSQRSMWIGFLIGVVALSTVAATAWFVNHQLAGPVAVRSAASPEPPRREPGRESHQASNRAPGQALHSPTPTPRAPASSAALDTSAAPPQARSSGAVQRADNVDQLDPADRARIEGLSLNVVSYSDVPARRFIMVNQRIVHESETVGDGVVVKRILPNGALLDVGKYEVMLRPN